MNAETLCLVGFVLASSGCASEMEGTGGTSNGVNGSNTIHVGPLEAPVLENVIPMSKVLRVQWTLPSTCDSVDGERRTDQVTFIPVFTTFGTDTDYVDDEAYEDTSYTYRIRCVRGDDASDWSNTLGANPFIQ